MAINVIPGSDIKKVTEKTDKLSVVDFSAEWCGPCKMIHPVLETISENLSDKLDVYYIDVDKNPVEANQFSVRGIPTPIIFHKGKEIDRMIGFRDANSLINHISDLAADHLE